MSYLHRRIIGNVWENYAMILVIYWLIGDNSGTGNRRGKPIFLDNPEINFPWSILNRLFLIFSNFVLASYLINNRLGASLSIFLQTRRRKTVLDEISLFDATVTMQFILLTP